jgi:U4/U6 small nuclear ribonucleoprotein PRP4
MPEYYDLNEDSKEEQIRYNEILKQFETKQKARLISVPTAIVDVKSKLREMGQPVTLYGEDHADRRERLKEVLARIELDKEYSARIATSTSSSSSSVPGPTMVTQEDFVASRGSTQKEVFYSPACDALIVVRKEVAIYSFSKAQERLLRIKTIRENDSLIIDDDNFVHDLYMNSKDLTLNSSQVGDDRPLTSIRYSSDGALIASGSLSGVVKVWRSDSLSSAGTFRTTLDRITSVAWSSGTLFAATSADGVCYIHDYSKYTDPLDQPSETSHNDVEMEVEGDGNTNNDEDGDFDQTSRRRTTGRLPLKASAVKLSGHIGLVSSCEFHPSGKVVGTAGHDCTWRLWDVERGSELLLQDGHTKDLSAIAFHPDGSLVMSADSGGVALLWDIRSGQLIQTFQGHIKKISGLSFSANGFQAASSSLDNTVKIWDLRRKKCFYTLPAHNNVISDVRYSHSGELLLSSSFDGTIKVWSSRDFHVLRTLSGLLTYS